MVRSLPVVLSVGVFASAAAYGFTDVEAPVVPPAAVVTTGEAGPSTLDGTWPVPEPPKPTAPTAYPVAHAIGPTVGIYSSPEIPYGPKPQLANPTHEGLPVVFLVLEDRGPWLRVRVSSRPNELVAWVQRSEVELTTVPNRVVVEVGARRVTVYHGDEVILQETAAVGSARTPTPLGRFFVDGLVELNPATGPYGAGQISVAGFSDVHQSFGGGIGQIALHGTNRPDLVGQDVSNGCVRLSNDAIIRLSHLTPLGTPVDVVA